MTYSIRLFSGNSQYTAYMGTGLKAAKNAEDMARAILILTGGTADICVSYDHAGNIPLWHVVNGAATPTEHMLTANPAPMPSSRKDYKEIGYQAALAGKVCFAPTNREADRAAWEQGWRAGRNEINSKGGK